MFDGKDLFHFIPVGTKHTASNSLNKPRLCEPRVHYEHRKTMDESFPAKTPTFLVQDVTKLEGQAQGSEKLYATHQYISSKLCIPFNCMAVRVAIFHEHSLPKKSIVYCGLKKKSKISL